MNSNGGAVDNNPGRASTKASYQEHLQQQIAPAEPIGLIKPPVPQLRPTLERIAGALGKVLTRDAPLLELPPDAVSENATKS